MANVKLVTMHPIYKICSELGLNKNHINDDVVMFAGGICETIKFIKCEITQEVCRSNACPIKNFINEKIKKIQAREDF